MLFTNNNSMSLCENMVIDFILNEDMEPTGELTTVTLDSISFNDESIEYSVMPYFIGPLLVDLYYKEKINKYTTIWSHQLKFYDIHKNLVSATLGEIKTIDTMKDFIEFIIKKCKDKSVQIDESKRLYTDIGVFKNVESLYSHYMHFFIKILPKSISGKEWINKELIKNQSPLLYNILKKNDFDFNDRIKYLINKLTADSSIFQNNFASDNTTTIQKIQSYVYEFLQIDFEMTKEISIDLNKKCLDMINYQIDKTTFDYLIKEKFYKIEIDDKYIEKYNDNFIKLLHKIENVLKEEDSSIKKQTLGSPDDNKIKNITTKIKIIAEKKLPPIYNIEPYKKIISNPSNGLFEPILKYDFIKEIKSMCLVIARGNFINIAEMLDTNSYESLVQKFIEISYDTDKKEYGDVEFEKIMNQITPISLALEAIEAFVRDVCTVCGNISDKLISSKDNFNGSYKYEDAVKDFKKLQESFINIFKNDIIGRSIQRIKNTGWELGDMHQTIDAHRKNFNSYFNQFFDSLKFLEKKNIDVFDDEIFEKINKLCTSYYWNDFSDQNLDFGKILADFLRQNVDSSNRQYKIDFLKFMFSPAVIDEKSKKKIDYVFESFIKSFRKISDLLQTIGDDINNILEKMESIDNKIIELTPSLPEDTLFRDFVSSYERLFSNPSFKRDNNFRGLYNKQIKILSMDFNLKEIQKKYKVPLSKNDKVEIIQTYLRKGFLDLVSNIRSVIKNNNLEKAGFHSVSNELSEYCFAFRHFSEELSDLIETHLTHKLDKIEDFSKKVKAQNIIYDNNFDRAKDLLEQLRDDDTNGHKLAAQKRQDDALTFAYAGSIFGTQYSYLFAKDHKFTDQDVKYLENYIEYIHNSNAVNRSFTGMLSTLIEMKKMINRMKEYCKKNKKSSEFKHKAKIEQLERLVYAVLKMPKTYDFSISKEVVNFFQKDLDAYIFVISKRVEKDPFKDNRLANVMVEYYNNLNFVYDSLREHHSDIVDYYNQMTSDLDPDASASPDSTPQPTMTKDQAKDLLKQEKFLEKLKRIAVDQPLTWISRKIQSLRNWADRGLKETEKNKGFINLLKKAIYKAISFLSSLLGAKKDRDVKSIDYTKHKTYDAFKGWR